jgi:hypothetical protein
MTPHRLTDLDNLTLLCGPHHRGFGTAGWQCVMRNQLPHWISPAFSGFAEGQYFFSKMPPWKEPSEAYHCEITLT